MSRRRRVSSHRSAGAKKIARADKTFREVMREVGADWESNQGAITITCYYCGFKHRREPNALWGRFRVSRLRTACVCTDRRACARRRRAAGIRNRPSDRIAEQQRVDREWGEWLANAGPDLEEP